MADIVINEISQNYSYVIGDSSYCCVALPITASWGPAFTGYQSEDTKEDVLENVVWSRFKANSQGLEAFVSTYRGAAANYRLSQDYSYQMAVSLLTAGYDVLVCRLCPGAEATSMLRRSYVGKISDDWFDHVDANGNLLLPIWTDKESQTPIEAMPFVVNSEHPLTVSSTNPNFPGTSITAVTARPVTSEDDTGIYVTHPKTSIENQVATFNSTSESKIKQGDTLTVNIEFPEGSYSRTATVVSCVYQTPTGDQQWTPTTLQEGADYVVTTDVTTGTIGVQITKTCSTIGASGHVGAKLEVTYGYSYYKPNGIQVLFHVKGADAFTPVTWESLGIKTNDELTYTGDKTIETLDKTGTLTLTAKYPGTFGNRLQCTLRRMSTVGINYWNLIVYIVDTSGVRVAVENLNFVFDIQHSTDNILFWEEIESQFITIEADNLTEDSKFTESPGDIQEDKLTIVFNSGKDKPAFTDTKTSLSNAINYAASRFNTEIFPIIADSQPQVFEENVAQGSTFTVSHTKIQKVSLVQYKASESSDLQTLKLGTDYSVTGTDETSRTVTLLATSTIIPQTAAAGSALEITYAYIETVNNYEKKDSNIEYVKMLCNKYNDCLSDPSIIDDTTAATWEYLEWLFTFSLDVYDLLHDKLAYNPNRVISPGWDDQNFLRLTGDESYTHNITTPSPLHLKLMETAYYARCATAYIDLPRSLAKKHVSNDSQNTALQGYAQLLARQEYPDTDGLFTTHSALFGPWGSYRYVGMSRQSTASPSFLALLIQRSMILNQSLQYEWIQPSSRKNNVNIGKMDYTVSKKYLDIWQPDPDTDGGVGVNAIANIPDLGLSIWGDSTLYENPPATYQALRNLSTRLLVNAIKNVVYKVGISITFQYTNQTAFSSFYVGVTPILDSMKNAGAIDDYKVIIGNDFDAVGMVKANSCVGKIYITPNGTIQHITVDLIALPPQTDLSNYS